MINRELSKSCLETLFAYGVREVVVCPGARCAPMLDALEKDARFKIKTHFDERAAGFYALGRIQALNQPVAVLTTSGTAVSELLPPVIEAHYNALPLVVVSSDRPKSYRGSGAPQTIEQVGIFGNYVSVALDCDALPLPDTSWDQKTPAHLNLCFDEPLL